MIALLLLAALAASARSKPHQHCPPAPSPAQLLNVTSSGYLPIDDEGSRLFYIFSEAAELREGNGGAPITLWLQVGSRP